MAANNIVDLDVLRPKPRCVRIGGTEIDVSFVPCGITFEVDELIQKLRQWDEATLEKGGAEAKEAFDLSIELCAVFCRRDNPELTVEWFRENTDINQIKAFVSAIEGALTQSYEGVEQYQANPQKAQRKKAKTPA